MKLLTHSLVSSICNNNTSSNGNNVTIFKVLLSSSPIIFVNVFVLIILTATEFQSLYIFMYICGVRV